MERVVVAREPRLTVRVVGGDLLQRVELELGEEFALVGERGGCWPLLCDWMAAYVAGRSLPPPDCLRYGHLPPFRRQVLDALAELAFGEVVTYGEVASRLEAPRAARAVGSGCAANPFPLFIPCHRVVASGQRLGGFAYGTAVKELLLQFEGLR